MKSFTCSVAFLLLFMQAAYTQPAFITKGKIEFEKKVNIHKQLESEDDDTWRNMMKKSTPPVKTTYFDLYFDEDKTVYKPGKEVVEPQKIPDFLTGPATDNVVLTDLATQTSISQKTVFESVFSINDTLRKIEWKMSPDTRTIAGFECRKATAIIMDSVFVVAFFSDQVVPAGGPESFAGLPGMILGLAIPRLNSTWFATKLEIIEVKPTVFTAPKKGKKITNSELRNQLKTSMKNWGKWGDKNIWQIMI
jgi:GLPGLI family protein